MSCPSTSSGELAVGTNVVTARPARLLGVSLTPAAAACSVLVYDDAAAASGTVLASGAAVANGASIYIPIVYGTIANKGLVAVVAGAGAKALLHYAAE